MCIPTPVLQLQERSWGSRALLTVEGEGLDPLSHVLPLLDSLLIPLSECWAMGRAAVAGGVRGGVAGAQLPWAEGLVAGLPFISPARATSPARAGLWAEH